MDLLKEKSVAVKRKTGKLIIETFVELRQSIELYATMHLIPLPLYGHVYAYRIIGLLF